MCILLCHNVLVLLISSLIYCCSLSYDEFLQLSQKGNNFVLDLIVKDICGELVCQKVCCQPLPVSPFIL
jgi:pantothenate kinase